eukprot:c10204_g1_i1.p1 GENE.c10204_g1_i1~~c10204_g1_i1.p1  ORF type:complete len:452 (-),score=101.13 c10204_g1_i1:299-1654(-)
MTDQTGDGLPTIGLSKLKISMPQIKTPKLAKPSINLDNMKAKIESGIESGRKASAAQMAKVAEKAENFGARIKYELQQRNLDEPDHCDDDQVVDEAAYDTGVLDNVGYQPGQAPQSEEPQQPITTTFSPESLFKKQPRQQEEYMVFGYSEPVAVAVVCQLLLLRSSAASIRAVIEPASSFTKRPSPHPQFTVPPQKIEVVTCDSLAEDGDNTLSQLVRPCACAFIVPPHSSDCVARASAIIRACLKAHVKMIVLLSTLSAGTKTLVGDWYTQIEQNLKDLVSSGSEPSIPYTIIRRGIFFDEELASAATIKSSSTFYGPLGPKAPGTRIAISDVAKTAGQIILNPLRHHNKTYSLCSRPFTMFDLSTIWTEILRRPIVYKQVQWEQAYEAALANGFKPWEITALVQQLEAQQAGDTSALLPADQRGDLEAITGCRPITIREWCESVRSMFV